MKTFSRPMLAASLLSSKVEHSDENILSAMYKLRYPVDATEKIDGIRAERANRTLLSRTLKPIPNDSIRSRASILPGGYDMELYNPTLQYNEIESIVMSKEHVDSDKIEFHVLDTFGIENANYEQRMYHINGDVRCWPNCPFKFQFPIRYNTPEELFTFFLYMESKGAEGICFRLPTSLYKQGRSTLKEQGLVKLARFVRTELTITGFKEQMENGNPDLRNDVGYMKRSTEGHNMYGKNTLGSFICVDPITYESVDVGTGVGLTDRLRKEIWSNQERFIGKTIVVKHKSIGAKNKLRHPIYVGFREKGY